MYDNRLSTKINVYLCCFNLFDYFHTLSDCNPVWIHGNQINEMKFLFLVTNTRTEYMYCEGNVSIFNCLKRGLHETSLQLPVIILTTLF